MGRLLKRDSQNSTNKGKARFQPRPGDGENAPRKRSEASGLADANQRSLNVSAHKDHLVEWG
jgi:hypothetical protein